MVGMKKGIFISKRKYSVIGIFCYKVYVFFNDKVIGLLIGI